MTVLRQSLELLETTDETVQIFLTDWRQFLGAGNQDCHRRCVVRHPCNGSPNDLASIKFVDKTQLCKKSNATSTSYHGLDQAYGVRLHMDLRFLPVAGVLEGQRAR